MTLRELIEQLETMAEDFGDDTRVMAAHQPSWPLAEEIGEPVFRTDGHEEEDDSEDIVWLPLVGHPSDRSPYAPNVWEW